ncbi:MAG: DNA polymerase III subunit alpha [candidate division Zixibacteria bacterium]|nr:DNA polymerase III subunit alpha [candidate division Zixibacteria bacterium]
MPFANFVHLHTHSQYSLLDGACRLDSVIKLAKEFKMPALAITDHGNMFGAIEFYLKARKAGIKPIIGTEAYVAGGSRFERKPSQEYPDGGYHLVLLVKNQTGYRNLMKLSSAGFREGFYHRPRIDKELLRQYSEGLIATSACLKGEIPWHLLHGNTEAAVATARELQDIFGEGNFYIELQNHNLEPEQIVIPKLVAIANETGIPLVATNDCHYLRKEDSAAHDALLCIQTGKTIEDTDRMRYKTQELYFKSPEEMDRLFGDFKEALANTILIAEKCNLELDTGKLLLPVFPIPSKYKGPDAFLHALCIDGLSRLYNEIDEKIQKRLDYELGIIKQMGYAGYFLIVKDFCDYARSRNIRVGPGRGSAAGSLVSYALGITSIDPMKFELLFERFLNPERISMPDIDIDFADRDRDKIIKYVIDKYGEDNVCQIITFGTMAARAVIRDVGRVLAIPYSEVDKIAKLIPEKIGITLEEALVKEPELAELKKNDDRIDRLINYAMTLEGLTRHCSTHAAGVVIAPSALTNYVPLFKSSKDEITTQYDMKMVDKIGLLKMDFLGLRTLTVIDDALSMISENYPDANVDIDNLTLDDTEVFELFARGETIGVFQFESAGMREYLRKLNPETFTDITAMNALYRPGPLDSHMIDTYIECKHGVQKVEFLHPILEEILGATYGVIVFQEQVLKIANSLAGYSIGKADLLRKAMGKKDADLMAAQKKEFLDGADKQKIARKISSEVFQQIETFARYGFNKAHSTCYAFVAYQTAWLKRYYPKEFMAALMTSEINDSNRIYVLMEECHKMGVEVLPPDINYSKTDFSVVDGKIRFGLQAVKNVGVGPAKAIVNEREEAETYTDMANLVSRVPLKSLNRRTMESLVAAGACDTLQGHRAQQHKAVEAMLEFGHKVAEQTSSHDLFADSSGEVIRTAPTLPEVDEWSTSQRLTHEKDMLGFYVSGHPLDKYRDELNAFTSFAIGHLEQASDEREVTLGGIVASVKTVIDKRGNTMAFVTIEDYTGTVELILFSDCYSKSKDLIVVDQMVLVIGSVSTREGEKAKVIGNEVLPLEKLEERFNCQLVIKISYDCSDSTIKQALASLEEFRGDTPVLLTVRENGSEVYIKSRKYTVNPDFTLLNRLKDILGESNAYLRPINIKNNFSKG